MITLVPIGEVEKSALEIVRLALTEAFGQRTRLEAPTDFEFTLKAWQLITHPTASPTYRKAGINKLEEIAKQKRTAIICAERLPWRCHRRFIALELEERGWRVSHIIDKGGEWVPGKRSANGKQLKLT